MTFDPCLRVAAAVIFIAAVNDGDDFLPADLAEVGLTFRPLPDSFYVCATPCPIPNPPTTSVHSACVRAWFTYI